MIRRTNEWIFSVINISPEIQIKIATSIIAIFLLWIIRIIVVKVVWRRTDDAMTRYRWRKSITYIMVTIGAVVIGRVWFEGMQSAATYLGLLSAGLAIALKDIVSNFAGWAFILWRRPFSVGDRVQIGEHAGDVIDIRAFQFTLMEIGNWVDADQSTGRVVQVPNGLVLSQVLANYSKGFHYIWNEIPVLVTFESNWKKAKEILQDIASKHAQPSSQHAERRIKEASKKYLIFYSALTPTVYTSVKDSGTSLTIRYLCEPKKRRGSTQAIWEEILTEFSRCDDIDFAYPTRRFYNNRSEGKVAARAPAEK